MCCASCHGGISAMFRYLKNWSFMTVDFSLCSARSFCPLNLLWWSSSYYGQDLWPGGASFTGQGGPRSLPLFPTDWRSCGWLQTIGSRLVAALGWPPPGRLQRTSSPFFDALWVALPGFCTRNCASLQACSSSELREAVSNRWAWSVIAIAELGQRSPRSADSFTTVIRGQQCHQQQIRMSEVGAMK